MKFTTTSSPDLLDPERKNIFMNVEDHNTVQIGYILPSGEEYTAVNNKGTIFSNGNYKCCIGFLVRTYEKPHQPKQEPIIKNQTTLF